MKGTYRTPAGMETEHERLTAALIALDGVVQPFQRVHGLLLGWWVEVGGWVNGERGGAIELSPTYPYLHVAATGPVRGGLKPAGRASSSWWGCCYWWFAGGALASEGRGGG